MALKASWCRGEVDWSTCWSNPSSVLEGTLCTSYSKKWGSPKRCERVLESVDISSVVLKSSLGGGFSHGPVFKARGRARVSVRRFESSEAMCEVRNMNDGLGYLGEAFQLITRSHTYLMHAQRDGDEERLVTQRAESNCFWKACRLQTSVRSPGFFHAGVTHILILIFCVGFIFLNVCYKANDCLSQMLPSQNALNSFGSFVRLLSFNESFYIREPTITRSQGSVLFLNAERAQSTVFHGECCIPLCPGLTCRSFWSLLFNGNDDGCQILEAPRAFEVWTLISLSRVNSDSIMNVRAFPFPNK